MTLSLNERQVLEAEHLALMQLYGAAQRCSSAVEQLNRQLVQQQAENMRLRAKTIIQLSQLAWRIHDALLCDLASALPDANDGGLPPPAPSLAPPHTADMVSAFAHDADFDSIAHSLQAADVVICQTGCLGHGDYWRVQDHCRRTGKACVFVDPSQAIQLLRIHPRVNPSEQAHPVLVTTAPP